MSRRPLRILFISSNMPWRGGGTFYRILGFGSELARRGHDVTLLMTSLKQKAKVVEESTAGVRIVMSPALLVGRLRTGWDPYEVLRRCRWLRGRRFDVIHGFESRPVVIYPALFATGRNRAPLILDWCDWLGRGGLVEERVFGFFGELVLKPLLRRAETFFEERFRRRARATTVICEALARRAEGLGVPPESIHLIRNGADVDSIEVLHREEARDALGLDPSIPLIGHLGHAFRRDMALMAQAFARVREQLPDSRLLLIGNYRDDIIRHMPDAAVLETGYARGVRLNQYLASCDVHWLPLSDTLANRGRWPMKLSDYMSSGRATVSTAVGDWSGLFRGDQPVGVLAAAAPADFAEKTLSLLADESSRRVYGSNARRVAESRFDWPSWTGKLESLYYQTIGSRLE